MAKLILSLDGMVLKEIPLVKERTTIGRKPHNDIQIDNLAVSGEHAIVAMIANDCFVEDLGSTNGTLINGKSVKKQFLQNNDVIELGKYKLKYFGATQPSKEEPAGYEQTMVWRPATMNPPGQPAAAAPTTPTDGTAQGEVGRSSAAPPSSGAASIRSASPPTAATAAAQPPRSATPAPGAGAPPTPPPAATARAAVAATPGQTRPATAPGHSAAPPSAASHASARAATPPAPTEIPVESYAPRAAVSPLWKAILVVTVIALALILWYRMRG